MVTYVRLRFQFHQWPEKLISELLIRKKLEIIQLQCNFINLFSLSIVNAYYRSCCEQ